MHEPVEVVEWLKVVARLRLGKGVKAIAKEMARFADYKTGLNCRPGLARLAYESEYSYEATINAVAALRELGLVAKTGVWHDADVYRLTLPDATVVKVPSPTVHEAAIQRIRDRQRGVYKGGGRKNKKRLPLEKQGAETQDTTDGPQEAPVCPEENKGQTEMSAPRFSPSTEASAPRFSEVCPVFFSGLPIDHPLEEVPSSTNHCDEDLSTDVLVPSDPGRDENDSQIGDGEGDPRELAEVVSINVRGTCPHGNSTRRNRHGLLRCEECREAPPAEPVVIIPTAEAIAEGAASVQLNPATCAEHGMPTGKCLFCRRGLPGKEATG